MKIRIVALFALPLLLTHCGQTDSRGHIKAIVARGGTSQTTSLGKLSADKCPFSLNLVTKKLSTADTGQLLLWNTFDVELGQDSADPAGSFKASTLTDAQTANIIFRSEQLRPSGASILRKNLFTDTLMSNLLQVASEDPCKSVTFADKKAFSIDANRTNSQLLTMSSSDEVRVYKVVKIKGIDNLIVDRYTNFQNNSCGANFKGWLKQSYFISWNADSDLTYVSLNLAKLMDQFTAVSSNFDQMVKAAAAQKVTARQDPVTAIVVPDKELNYILNEIDAGQFNNLTCTKDSTAKEN